MRILLISNSPQINSGYSVVTKNLCRELIRRGHYCAIVGAQTQFMIDKYDGIDIYPMVSPDVGLVDQVGMIVNDFKPDIVVFVFQCDDNSINNDIMNIKTSILDMYKIESVLYTTVEGINLSNNAVNLISKFNNIAVPTQFGVDEINKKLKMDVSLMPYGVDHNVFKPVMLSELLDEKLGCNVLVSRNKSKFRPVDTMSKLIETINSEFTVTFVGQNIGVRKRIERLMEAFKLFLMMIGNRSSAMLHLHTLPVSTRGLNLIDIATKYDMADNVMFTYGIGRSSVLSENTLNVLYNIGDVFATASSGEGMGLPIIEAMSTGRPIVAPAFSSIPEVVYRSNKHGGLLVHDYQLQMSIDGAERCLVNTKRFAEKLYMMFDDKKLRKELGMNAFDISNEYTWKRTVDLFEKVCEGISKR